MYFRLYLLQFDQHAKHCLPGVLYIVGCPPISSIHAQLDYIIQIHPILKSNIVHCLKTPY